uniref:Uncharacterized protein n=1 Tax=Ciona savignyi TaxID=51511 RepID=H2YRZ0_CIOSA
MGGYPMDGRPGPMRSPVGSITSIISTNEPLGTDPEPSRKEHRQRAIEVRLRATSVHRRRRRNTSRRAGK